MEDFDVVEFLHELTERCVQLLELVQLQTGRGPSIDCFRTGQPVSAPDLAGTGCWPPFARAAAAVGFTAVHALPMRLRTQTIGALNLFTTAPGLPDSDTLRIGQALADVATIGLLQQRAIHHRDVLTEQLQTALHSRILIEQAKGVVAECLNVDMVDAFTLLRSHARNHNRRLSDLAQAIVEGAEQIPTRTPSDAAASARTTPASHPVGPVGGPGSA